MPHRPEVSVSKHPLAGLQPFVVHWSLLPHRPEVSVSKHPLAGLQPLVAHWSVLPHRPEVSVSKHPLAGLQPLMAHWSVLPHRPEVSVSKHPLAGLQPLMAHWSLLPQRPEVSVTKHCPVCGSQPLSVHWSLCPQSFASHSPLRETQFVLTTVVQGAKLQSTTVPAVSVHLFALQNSHAAHGTTSTEPGINPPALFGVSLELLCESPQVGIAPPVPQLTTLPLALMQAQVPNEVTNP